MNKKEKFNPKIGDEVWVIYRDLTVTDTTIKAIKQTEKGVVYTYDSGANTVKDTHVVFETEGDANKHKKEFLDNLIFSIGDIIVYQANNMYSSRRYRLAKIQDIFFSETPYGVVMTRSKNHYPECIHEYHIDKKLKNSYVETYGNIIELMKEFEEKAKELSDISSQIDDIFEEIEGNIDKALDREYKYEKSSLQRFIRKPDFKHIFYYEKDW